MVQGFRAGRVQVSGTEQSDGVIVKLEARAPTSALGGQLTLDLVQSLREAGPWNAQQVVNAAKPR